MVQQVFGKSGNQEYQFVHMIKTYQNCSISEFPIQKGCSLTKTKQAVHKKPGVACPKSRATTQKSLCPEPL